MQVALALPGLDADAVELALLRAGHRIAWRATGHDEVLAQLGEVVPDVVLVADDPAVATAEVVAACDLLGVRTCLVRADDALSATAGLLGVHDILRAVPGRPIDLAVLSPAFDALDGGIDEAAGAHPGFAGARPATPATPMRDAPPAPAPSTDLDPAEDGGRARRDDARRLRPRAPHRIDPPALEPEASGSRSADRSAGRGVRRWPWSRSTRDAELAAPPAPPAAAAEHAGEIAADAAPLGAADEREGASDSPARRIVAVWGPAGAPGRTTIAIALAAELASRGLEVCLVDSDTYGGTIAPTLGLLDEAPGFAAACRLAGSDALDDGELDRIALTYGGTATPFRVLTGIGRPHRWPELSRDRVARALEATRSWCDVVVVDTGFNLETDEEVSSDLLAPRRNAATIAALRAADDVVVVGAADPVGLARLLRTHADLLETVTTDRVHVVANRVRASVLGIDPAGQVRQTLDRFGGITDPVLIADDPGAADAALLSARTVVDCAPRSALWAGVAPGAARVGFAPGPAIGRARALRSGRVRAADGVA